MISDDLYSGKIRIRSCGLLVSDGSILLVQLKSPVTNTYIWTPPGGGLQFGETLKEGLQREFKEETGLDVRVGELIHIHEFIKERIHALEFYFVVGVKSGNIKLGTDPEFDSDSQILKDIGFHKLDKLNDINFKPESLIPVLQSGDNPSFPVIDLF